MGIRKDRKSIIYAVSTLAEVYTSITSYTVSEEEDYGPDSQFTAVTHNGTRAFDVEVKTVRKSAFKNGEQWCSTWSTEAWENMRYCDIPSSSITPDMLTGWTTTMTEGEIDKDRTPIPEHIKGKHLYILNATTSDSTATKAKAHKLFQQGNYYLIYLAADGMIIYNPSQLRRAFMGYGWYKVTHTTDIGRQGRKHWELKALLDLGKGTYLRSNTPPQLIKKK